MKACEKCGQAPRNYQCRRGGPRYVAPGCAHVPANCPHCGAAGSELAQEAAGGDLEPAAAKVDPKVEEAARAGAEACGHPWDPEYAAHAIEVAQAVKVAAFADPRFVAAVLLRVASPDFTLDLCEAFGFVPAEAPAEQPAGDDSRPEATSPAPSAPQAPSAPTKRAPGPKSPRRGAKANG